MSGEFFGFDPHMETPTPFDDTLAAIEAHSLDVAVFAGLINTPSGKFSGLFGMTISQMGVAELNLRGVWSGSYPFAFEAFQDAVHSVFGVPGPPGPAFDDLDIDSSIAVTAEYTGSLNGNTGVGLGFAYGGSYVSGVGNAPTGAAPTFGGGFNPAGINSMTGKVTIDIDAPTAPGTGGGPGGSGPGSGGVGGPPGGPGGEPGAGGQAP